MSTVAPKVEPHTLVSRTRCPHLGSADDPVTSTLYPSPIGHCYHANPHEAIDLDHQARYCLSAEHPQCPVFQLAQAGRLPKELRRKGTYSYGDEVESNWSRRLGTVLLLGLLAGMIFIFTQGLALNETDETPVAAANPPTATRTPTLTPTTTPSQQPSPSPHPTQTPAATIPATFTVSPAEPTATHTLAPSATATPGEIVVLATTYVDDVNVRSGPHISYPIVWLTGTAGVTLTVTGQADGGGWLQVCCQEGVGGWIALETVSLSDDLATVPVIPVPAPSVVIVPVLLNIRLGPGISYSVLGIAEKDQTFDIVASYEDGLWWQVCCIDGRRGWVIGESVVIYGDASLIPQAVNIPPTPTFTPEPVAIATATPGQP